MKSLFFICHLLVLYGMSVSLMKQYIYVSDSKSWTSAQSHCRALHGELASITTEEENQKALQVLPDYRAWIGLKRTTPHINIWEWTDGEKQTITKWFSGEPNDYNGEDCIVMTKVGWYDTSCSGRFPVICSRRFILVKENKTWEEALKYCQIHYTKLAFVDSETLLNLLKIETERAQTASVWTGLRFLNGKWFWVNGVPLEIPVSLPSCPVRPYCCGAYNFNTYVWENRDCNEKLNFLCYH